MLSRKFFRDGVRLESAAALATSGIAIEAANAAAVAPATALSFRDDASTRKDLLLLGFLVVVVEKADGTDLVMASPFG
ncbi:unnamed protein product [Linum tenue]|uniref:Uncharacterized protein n=1 Tax=Linum tenue TaxID=586396 RepID=A0AAV0MQV2_9ROSI|nr:unnamed protein product [Linum tenue]